ncbi:MAG: UDP-N-acetylglucosamine 1-carboxyvinyltransferase [Chloroflexi bacterium]|nr:UDP-N-acetylglucosamine 1-carboxyvinyltransferase [Chloroflexota bacterium]
MQITVNGRSTLDGDYYPSGNSNAVLASIAASLITDAPSHLERVSNSQRTSQMLDIARQLGSEIIWDSPSSLTIQTPHIQTRNLDFAITSQVPASVLFIAPIIARRRHARLEWDSSISRLYSHLTALRDLGQEIEIDGDAINIVGNTWDEQSIILAEMSVTATALVCMLAAVLGRKTSIFNAASEPHLRILQHQLVQMGAKIDGIGSNLLTVHGIAAEPRGASVTLPPDHIEIASIAALAAITPGQISIHDVYLPDMQMILKVYERLGMQFYLQAPTNGSNLHTLHIPEQTALRAARRVEESDVAVDTAPWPGFPSDLIATTTVLSTQTSGTTLIHEKLYNNRMFFIDKLKAMGAQIVLCDPHRAIVIGRSTLRGEYIDTPDVRTGLAMLIAALCAKGESVIDNAQVFNYVFDGVVEKLQAINADIKVNG